MSQQVIVLGMHRSYTTLLASWLHDNGILMFDPKISTPRYHEDPEIFNLHEEFLRSQGMNWMNARAPFVDPSHAFRNRCYQLWQDRNQQAALWGWKDPRTCILYEFLWESFSQSAKFIIVYRDPSEVVESLLVRKIKKRRHALLVPDVIYQWHLRRHRIQYDSAHLVCWNYYNRCLLEILKHKNPNDYLVLDAHTLVSNEKKIYHRLTETWQMPLSGKSLSAMVQPMTIRHTPNLQNLDSLIHQETTQILKALQKLQSFETPLHVATSQ